MPMKNNKIITEDIEHVLASDIIKWDDFTDKKFLITGVTGLIGYYLFYTLLSFAKEHPEKRIQVTGLARNEVRANNLFSSILTPTIGKIQIQNIKDPLSFESDADYIIHAASEASPKYYLEDPIGTINANIYGTQQLLELARRNNGQLLFLSSGTVYGDTPTEKPTQESNFGPYDPLDIRACYAESKRMAETLCYCYTKQYGVDTRIARISHTYGPSVELDDGRVFGDFLADAVANRPIRVRGDGGDSRPFLYIKDATEALLMLLQKGDSGGAYNIGAEIETSIGELATLIGSLSGQPIVFSKPTDFDYSPSTAVKRQGRLSIEKMKMFGWRPKTDVRNGFSRTLSHFGIPVNKEYL